LKLEVMVSFMTDDQFMIQVLNSLTNDYKLQMLLLEKWIGSKENPLNIDESKEDLSLRYERLLMKTETAKINDLGEEKALVVTQFKGKRRNWGKIGHKPAQCKSKHMREERNEVVYNYCKKPGHVKSNCFKFMKKKQVEENGYGTRNGVAGTVTDIVLSSVESKEKVDHEIWIGDSGASCHYCNDNEGLYDYKTTSEEITVGNGNVLIAKKVGKLRCGILQKNGEKLIVTLENVKYVPELWINLFGIGKALKYGFNLSNDGEIIKLSNGNVTSTFDKVMRTKNGFVPGIKLLQVLGDVGTSILGTKKRDTIDVNNLHKILGHCSEVNTRLTGKAYGYKVTDKFDVCEACSIAKARQKNINKEWKGGSLIRGERFYVDISSIKGTSFGESKF
jgi:hypothetical protein